MHELSIALSIVDMAAEEGVRLGATRVRTIRLKIGPLSGVVPDSLRFAFELAREQEPLLATAELDIEEVPLAAYCPMCSAERLVPFPELLCPVCGTSTPDIVRGRELEVVALEIESP